MWSLTGAGIPTPHGTVLSRANPDGPDATIVTETCDCSRAPEKERAGMDNGKIWIESMARALERLDALCGKVDQPGIHDVS